MTEQRFRVPHTLVLLFGMIVAALLLTYVLPQGSFERTKNEEGREQVVPGSYQRAPGERLSPLAAFTAIPRGFAAAQEIIFFVFIVGGAFAVFRATGAADALISFLLARMRNVPALLIAGGIFVFAAGSATIGMAEEYIPFVPILLALCVALGYDVVTAIGILCIGYGTGYGAALINPFTVFIAQNVAGLQPGSGLGFRVILLAVFLLVAFDHVWRYARRVKADPSRSYMAGVETSVIVAQPKEVTPTARHVAVIAVVIAALGVLIWGLKWAHWYLIEMGALFLGLTIILAIIGRLGFNTTAKEFATGAQELTTTALLIGFARSIQIVLDDGRVIDTIINGIAQPLQALTPHAAAVGMFLVQSVINFFIPSGSGQAYVTMPIMAPLADLVGVSRQVAVLAFQFGDGFTNIIVPTNPVLMGILAMAGIPYQRWLRFVVPFILKVWVAGSIALVIAVSIGYS
ncbi:MAG TPA: AbgT family transporter [Thermoanaerobaculia bacterium]|nr:AbgT family transporter [Thermoanaerobaculia bacterium]